MDGNGFSDAEIRDRLTILDDRVDIDVDPWEADFLERVLFRQGSRSLSSRQRVSALRMIEKYLGW